MLFLTRKPGQSIIINDVIELNVVEVNGKTVKLGFKFPPTESVLRSELYEKIKKETQQAARSIVNISGLAESVENNSSDITSINLNYENPEEQPHPDSSSGNVEKLPSMGSSLNTSYKSDGLHTDPVSKITSCK